MMETAKTIAAMLVMSGGLLLNQTIKKSRESLCNFFLVLTINELAPKNRFLPDNAIGSPKVNGEHGTVIRFAERIKWTHPWAIRVAKTLTLRKQRDVSSRSKGGYSGHRKRASAMKCTNIRDTWSGPSLPDTWPSASRRKKGRVEGPQAWTAGATCPTPKNWCWRKV